jgi:ABC-2 type transport system ATP-binding protein
MTSHTAPAIALQGLVKSFRGPDGPVRAVRGIDVSIEGGETVALLGPNGAGKSTTLDMLLGLSEPDAGAVSVFGRSPHNAVAAGEVGAMLQTGAPIGDLSVRELVAMMASLYPRPLDVEDVLGLTGILAVADQRTQKLSGGQTQRVRLALALVSDPELLVLDEPTVGLDVEARRGFWAAMRAFAVVGGEHHGLAAWLTGASNMPCRSFAVCNAAGGLLLRRLRRSTTPARRTG